MTEQEWLEYFDSERMLELLSGDRKLRLFAVGYCRRIWYLLVHQCSRETVEVAERFADGLATTEELAHAWNTVWNMPWNILHFDQGHGGRASDWAGAAAGKTAHPDAWWAASGVARWASWAVALTGIKGGLLSAPAEAAALDAAKRAGWSRVTAISLYAARERQCRLLRCIYSNPGRPITLDRAWQTRKVCALAHDAYNNRFLPAGTLDKKCLFALASALEDAGCTDSAILNHC